MPYTTPHTITVGELVTVDTMNDEWGGNVAFLANPPACRVYHNAAQASPNLTEQALAMNSERYDTDSMHSTVSNTSRITFNTAGLYVVSGHGRFVAAAAGIRQFGIRLNGTTYIATHLQAMPGAGVVVPMSVSTVYKFAATNYVELVSFQDSGGSLNVESVANTSPEFAATWIGRG